MPKLQKASIEDIDIKVKFRHPILGPSIIVEEVFALEHCCWLEKNWLLPSADGRTV